MISTADSIFSLALASLSALGLVLQSGIASGGFRRHMFAYYTNLSNLAVFLYELLFFVSGLFGGGPVYGFARDPSVRFVEMLMILTTHLIYHWVLGAGFIKRSIEEDIENGLDPAKARGARLLRRITWPIVAIERSGYEDSRGFLGNLTVHYLVPLVTLVRWLILADKAVPFAATFGWLAIPTAYLVFAVIRARFGEPITKRNGRYPYRFMDLDYLGPRRFFVSIALVTGALYVLGVLFWLIAKLF